MVNDFSTLHLNLKRCGSTLEFLREERHGSLLEAGCVRVCGVRSLQLETGEWLNWIITALLFPASAPWCVCFGLRSLPGSWSCWLNALRVSGPPEERGASSLLRLLIRFALPKLLKLVASTLHGGLESQGLKLFNDVGLQSDLLSVLLNVVLLQAKLPISPQTEATRGADVPPAARRAGSTQNAAEPPRDPSARTPKVGETAGSWDGWCGFTVGSAALGQLSALRNGLKPQIIALLLLPLFLRELVQNSLSAVCTPITPSRKQWGGEETPWVFITWVFLARFTSWLCPWWEGAINTLCRAQIAMDGRGNSDPKGVTFWKPDLERRIHN